MRSSSIYCLKALYFFLIGMFIQNGLNGQNTSGKVNPENTIWFNKPAEKWLDAFPIGNGRLGAMVFGDAKTEHLQLNEDSMWPGANDQGDAQGNPDDLKQIRSYLDQGKPHLADSLIIAAFSYKGIVRSHQTMGDLFIHFKNRRKISNYKRELCLDNALVAVSYTVGKYKFSERVFSSAIDDLIVIEMTSDDPNGIFCEMQLSRPEDNGHPTVFITNPAANEISMYGKVTQYGGKIHSTATPMEYGVRFEARLRVRSDKGNIQANNGKLTISGSQRIVVYLSGSTNFYHQDFRLQNEKTLDAAESISFDDLLVRHINDFSYYFNRVSFFICDSVKRAIPVDQRISRFRSDLDDPGLIALLFQFGRYLMISCSRPGCNPANLQGLWNPYIEAPWNADYHLNINLEMNYWPAEVTNLSEMHQPLFDFADRLLHRGEKTALEQYGIKRGTVAHQATDIWAPAWMQAEQPYWGAWIHGAGWLSLHYWEHFQFTLDTEFLRARAYPVLKNCAAFYLDWLQLDSVSGEWISYPETSPENSYLAADGRPAAVSRGAAMGYQIIHDVFRHTVEAAKILGINDELIQEIKDKLKNLHSGIVVWKDGRILEWDTPYDEPEKGHRHMSHLYALYPGNEITPMLPEAFDAARKTIDYRLRYGGAGTGWSRAWLICFEARLLDSYAVLNNIQTFISTAVANNLFALHPPFQIDANFGFTAGVAEALLQSHEDFIRLLPSLPDKWQDGYVKGLVARGNITVDMEWTKGHLSKAKFKSPITQRIAVKYKSKIKSIDLVKGQVVYLDKYLNQLK